MLPHKNIRAKYEGNMTCPICGKRITPEDAVIKDLKHVISSSHVSQDVYLQKSVLLHYYCCSSCNMFVNTLNFTYKGFYAIGIVLIAVGYITDSIFCICGLFMIFLGLLVYFLVPAIFKKYPNVTIESAIDHNCLIEKIN